MHVPRQWYLLALLTAATLAACAPQCRGESQDDKPRWRRGPDMPLGTFAAAASLSGDKAVVSGGITQSGLITNAIQVFNLRTQEWSIPARTTLGRFGHAQVTLADGRVLIAGGRSGVATQAASLKTLDDAHVFNAGDSSVLALPPLPVPMEQPTAHVLTDGSAIVIGERHAAVLDPATLTWAKAIMLHGRRRAHASVVLTDGRVLVVGGVNSNSAEIINPADGVSTRLPWRLPAPLDDLRLAALPDGRAWILGGQNSTTGDTTDRTWIVSDNTIEAGPPLSVERGMADHAIVTFGEWIVIAGGESQFKSKDTELNLARILNARTREVWTLPPMLQSHDDSCMVIHERTVYIFGGYRVRPALLVMPAMPIAANDVEMLTFDEAHLTPR